MPVVGTPTTPVIVSVDQVRMFLRDYADKNILLDDVQFTQKEVNFASEMATSAFNAVTPQSMLTAPNWPPHLQYVLLIGTARFLMQSESFLQIRNQATYQDGDIAPIGIDDKMAAYAQLAQQLKAEWDELVRGIKTQNNMEGAYNDLGSGYRNVSRYTHS
jgi:hypothetical protein